MTQEQYGQAYESGYKHTVRFLRSRGVNWDTAADVAQSAWLRAWERFDQLRDERVLVPWVNQIALNNFRKRYRREQRQVALEEGQKPAAQTAMNQAAVELAILLDRCCQRDRRLLFAQLSGVTAKELSERIGVSEPAIRLRYFRARTAARCAAERAA